MNKSSNRNISGHRDRMREKFSHSGFNGFHDYEILEFLLFSVLPRKDTKQQAKRLINKFGGFSKVLDAGIDEIAQVEGMGKKSAVSLKAFRNILAYYNYDKALSKQGGFDNMEELNEYIYSQIGGSTEEKIIVNYLSSSKELISSEIFENGGSESISVEIRLIVETALNQKSQSIIIAHNHTNGEAEPSAEDISFTEELKLALSIIGIDLEDHIIISDGSYFSFAEEEIL